MIEPPTITTMPLPEHPPEFYDRTESDEKAEDRYWDSKLDDAKEKANDEE
jgi:hypothetical protein